MGNLTKSNKPLNQVASIFDELFNNETFNTPRNNFGAKAPSVNIKETEDNFSLEFAIPGIKKEDVIIELDNEKLTVSAELKTEDKESKGNYPRREFHNSSFKRSFILPDTVEGSKISALHEDGILNIVIPKKEEAKPKPVRTIKID